MNHRITHAALGLIAATLIALGAFAVPVSAVALEASGETGSAADTDTSDYIVDWTECGTCVWSIDSEGTLVVKPADGAESGELPSIPWSDYKNKVRSVGFEGTVKAAKLQDAFRDMTSLETADLSGLDASSAKDTSFMFFSCTSLSSVELSGFNTVGVTDMSGMFDFCTSLKSIDVSSLDTSSVMSMSCMFYNCRALSSIDFSGLNTSKVVSMANMFSDCSNLSSIDLSRIDTSHVEDMSSMFSGCTKLSSINFSGLDTSSLTKTNYMFSYCSSLPSIDLSGLDVSHVKDMSNMFYSCAKLSAVDFSGLNISSLADASNMFSYCSKLGTVNFDGLDGPSIISMNSMFRSCLRLSDITLPSLGPENSVDVGFMFYECTKLSSVDLTNFHGAHITNMAWMFANSPRLSGVDLSALNISKVTSLDNLFSGCSSILSVDLSVLDASEVTSVSGMFSGCSKLASVELSGLGGSHLTSMDSMFSNCSNLSSIELSSLDASRVTSMDSMFSNCSNLSSIELSSLDTSRVTSMSSMFSGCSSLSSIDLSMLNTSRVTFMGSMFSSCAKLLSVKLSGLDLRNVTDMSYMFYACSSLSSIEFDDLNVVGVEQARSMFAECSSLTSIDLSSFDMSNLVDMKSMFAGCSSLSSIDFSGQDTSSVTDMSSLFSGCSALSSLDLSDFDTSRVVKMDGMFQRCSSLSSLDLSGFDTLLVTSMSHMFDECGSLVQVRLGSDFSFDGKGESRMTSLPDKWWRSSIDDAVFVSYEVPNNVAATYTKLEGIESASISVAEQTYTGLPIAPEVSVKIGDKFLKQGTDFTATFSDNVDTGVASVLVTGEGDYAGARTTSFSIVRADASDAQLTIASGEVYTGLPIEPEITINFGGRTLAEGTDYSVLYSNNVNAGAASVEVSFIGNYSGSIKRAFEIEPIDASGAMVEVAEQIWNGTPFEPEVKVLFNGKVLTRGTDYHITSSGSSFPGGGGDGVATVKVSFLGNYAGAAEGSARIIPASIASAEVLIEDQTYTGAPVEPAPRVLLDGKLLQQGFDYSVIYSDNLSAGTATAVVTGKGGYTGFISAAFSIVAVPDPEPTPTPAPDPEPEPVTWIFKDVSSSVAHSDDINWLASAGVSTGWAETDGTRTFRPYWNVARADMAAFLYRLAGSPDFTAPSTSPFKDVTSGTAHYKEICWLAENGISQGWDVSGGREFRPYATVARCDMAAFLYRLAGSPDYTISGKPFLDCNEKTPHYKEVCWLASTGVSAGWDVSGGKEFRSYNNVARADMAAFLHRTKDKGLV